MSAEGFRSVHPAPGASMVIATPIWRSSPTDKEAAFLRRTDETNREADRWFCAPENLDVGFYQQHFPDWRIQRFPQQAFASVAAYSMWLTAPGFYRSVDAYEFVTICQLDAVLMKDITGVDMSGMDYLGSPWVPPVKVLTPGRRIYVASEQGGQQGMWFTRLFGRELGVGNGGLSIRRVRAHIKATEWLSYRIPKRYRERTLEDVLLCAFSSRTNLRIAPTNVANDVFLETGAAFLKTLPDVYGFHGLWRWNPSLAESLSKGAR